MFPVLKEPGAVLENPLDERIIKKLKKMWGALKAFLRPPKSRETPDDVAERNRAFQLFCEQVNKEAGQVEVYVIEQLELYGQYLSDINGSDAYAFLQRYPINTKVLLRQMDFLKMQVPGIIGAEVSRRLSDTDGECLRIRRMLPGAEKEARMQSFLQEIIDGAMEKCAQATETIIIQIQSIFIDSLQDCLDVSRRQMEQTEAELASLAESAGGLAERERVRTQAEQVVECCELVSELF